jgi:hypothetical protein
MTPPDRRKDETIRREIAMREPSLASSRFRMDGPEGMFIIVAMVLFVVAVDVFIFAKDGLPKRNEIFIVVTYHVGVGAFIIVNILNRRAHRRIARRMNGQCVRCGYDIRATPDRCPECGNAINPR